MGVKVKALEWKHQGTNWTAATPWGSYYVYSDVNEWICETPRSPFSTTTHGSKEEAIDAGQKDFDDCILSCVEQE